MSLADAVLAVAEQMEQSVQEKDKDGTDLWPLTTKMLVRSHAAQLRIAVKASEGTQVLVTSNSQAMPPGFGPDGRWHSPAWHARQGTAPPVNLSRTTEAEEGLADRLVEVAGSSPPLLLPVPPDLPLGGKIAAAGVVYVLGESGKLHREGGGK